MAAEDEGLHAFDFHAPRFSLSNFGTFADLERNGKPRKLSDARQDPNGSALVISAPFHN